MQEYAYGLRPDYWFAPDNPRDLIRHQLKGYGNLLWVTLPFVVLGLIVALKNALRGTQPSTSLRATRGRSRARPACRVVLLLLVAPIGGVLVQANVLRGLVIVVPATLTTISRRCWSGLFNPRRAREVLQLGSASTVSSRRHLRRAHPRQPLPAHDALTNGRRYGNYDPPACNTAAAVFTAIRDHLAREPQPRWLFPAWLNTANAAALCRMIRAYNCSTSTASWPANSTSPIKRCSLWITPTFGA
jgi:hypothetical protein